ncbi:PQQ-dependent sugar dehydrogenase [Psychrobacter sp. DM4]|uniref:PQQ-dependent sugar dehydrogenase n=1 Tax=Psychrobacter sp. DM4 TaxID=3440637 RepID=UPI003F4F5FB5
MKNKYISAPLSLPVMIAALMLSTAACSEPTAVDTDNTKQSNSATATQTDKAMNTDEPEFTTKAVATFSEPWAMTTLPKTADGSLKLLVTQKSGELFVVDTQTGTKTKVTGVPEVAYGGQGGLGDVILSPDFATSNTIYLSHAEAGSGADSNKYGAKVIKATLTDLDTGKPSLKNISTIWQQNKKIDGQGHYSHRLLFSPDGRYLYISSGDRQEKEPAQDMSLNLGKIIRLYPDGTIPDDNPYISNNDISAQFWSTGHRNVLGMAFDESGRLWANEMGPRGGDEYNLITKGNNYGWPVVSNGRNYSGIDIPDHDTRPEFEPPKVSWTPVISPSSLSIYTSGSQNDFPAWQGDALMSGLSSQALIVVDMDAAGNANERYRYDMGARIRNVLTVEGQVWLLEDGDEARLLQLLPQ